MADIVVGVDGSPGSTAALRWAIAEGVRRDLPVRALLGSCSAESPAAVRRSADAAAQPRDEGALAHAAATVLHEAVESVSGPSTPPIIEEVVDAPGAEALLTAGRNAEMIVVGARGRGLLHRLRIGSVSASVAVHATVPVIVARVPGGRDAEKPAGGGPAAAGAPAWPRPVVVGVDGSPNSLAALRWAARAAALRGVTLHVVHAWLAAAPLAFAETSGEIVQALERQARVVLNESIDRTLGTGAGRGGEPGAGTAAAQAADAAASPDAGSTRAAAAGQETAAATETVVDTPAGPVVVRRALVPASATRALLEASRDADLLVVGARGRGGFAELLLGSVSHQSMLHAGAPVAIIRDV